jgi:carboxyl-terminal processing protease
MLAAMRLPSPLRVPGARSLLVAALALGSLGMLGGCGDDDPSSDLDLFGRCAVPRTGNDPFTGQPYDDEKGSLDDEKRFLRAWIDELYLWYREVPDVDADDYDDPVAYFDELKTQEKTASGKDKDQFHFTYPTDVWDALSRGGATGGYGATFSLLSSRPPREIVVAYTEPASPATTANLLRGARIISVDGVDVANGTDVDTLNAGLFPERVGETHTFVVRDAGAGDTREVMLTSANVTSAPVQNTKILDTPTGKVGYLTFNDHIATAEPAMAAAVNTLKTMGISDLVLDLRYNGGGYLAIAAQVAYMVAGPDATTGKTFEQLTFNDRYSTIDPYTGDELSPDPFLSKTVGFSGPAGQDLPALGLKRVFVLAGPGTCSASESIINGLRGIDVEVILIGATTCGKPYGFVPQDNCGTTYFAIQFQGVNQKGYGDYADGFVPAGTADSGVPGCLVPDDFSRQLGDPAEGRLAAALFYRANGRCPEISTARGQAADGGQVMKPVWQQNRIVTKQLRR